MYAAMKMTCGGVNVWVYAQAELPTQYGIFSIVVFRSDCDDFEHVALVHGKLDAQAEIPVRLHSECLTGDVFASLRCDCRAQLEHAMKALAGSPCGVLLYMRQEGRGIGLGNKIRAYALQQEQGLDTVDANLHLGFDDDLRDYRVAALMLHILGATKIKLFTNNPKKIEGLKSCGISVISREPLIVGQSDYNAAYLETKAKKSGHLLPST